MAYKFEGSNMKLNEILEKRGRIVDQMRTMLDKAEAENRDLTPDEQEAYNTMETDQTKLGARAERLQRIDSLEGSLDIPSDAPRNRGLHIDNDDDPQRPLASATYRAAFDQYARQGKATLSDPHVLNALQVGTDSEGGYIVPDEFEVQLVEIMQDINDFRPLVDLITTGGDRHIPVESSLGAAAWTGEEALYSESDAAFGRVTLQAHKLGTIIKVSEELLQDSFFDLVAYLARNFGNRFGIAEEAAIVNGDGTGKPTGLVQGASGSLVTAAPTAIVADELMDLYHDLKRPYRQSAVWVMNDLTVKIVRKLKDGQGQYLWQPGLQAGQPDMILGKRLITSDAMPQATTGSVSTLFGDLRNYTVAERSGRVMQRLNELYAANGQVGFRMFERLDGKTVNAEGIKKLTQG